MSLAALRFDWTWFVGCVRSVTTMSQILPIARANWRLEEANAIEYPFEVGVHLDRPLAGKSGAQKRAW